MTPEEIEITQTAQFWTYRQVDEFRRLYTLETQRETFGFIVALIELAEDYQQEVAFSMRHFHVKICVPIPEYGAADLQDFLDAIDSLARNPMESYEKSKSY